MRSKSRFSKRLFLVGLWLRLKSHSKVENGGQCAKLCRSRDVFNVVLIIMFWLILARRSEGHEGAPRLLSSDFVVRWK